ncbi:Putative aldehyde dehydrogenase FUS7 [Cladobotryum mycophilum]|uniref:aldehyde dehydrogenase (NAD(+)) n=1 Tax=Cladobotryum mycophilum TaxID=491253 RepID=A0ABR0S8Z9_9HYPO
MTSITFETFSNVIDGKLVATTDTRHGINPANQQLLPPVPVSTSDDVDRAVDAAKRAAPGWAQTPISERREKMVQFSRAISSHSEGFANMLVLEQGKPLDFAKREANIAASLLEGCSKLNFEEEFVVQDTDSRRIVTRYVPVGVSVGIVPWNFPVSLTIVKLGPALLAGSPIILKPSPFTPYAGLKIVELAQQFFPPGVVQALSGDDSLGPMLTAHPGIDHVSFTGSTQTGIKVMQSCAPTLKRVTLELGGNDPAIICADVDIATVAPKVAALAFANSGQVCVAIKRVYVHSSIYKEFLTAMTNYVKTFVVGDGLNQSTTMGPVQNSMQYEKLKQLVASIEEGNLKIATGDIKTTFPDGKGYFMNPVIVDNPPDSSKIVVEEPFGPALPVMQWDTEEEVVRRANDSESGLGASVWSRDITQANRIGNQIQAGNIWINTHLELQANAAFGGHKRSGIGAELGVDGVKAYCNVQTIYQAKL